MKELWTPLQETPRELHGGQTAKKMHAFGMAIHGGAKLGQGVAGVAEFHGGSQCTKAIIFQDLTLHGGAKVEELHCLKDTRIVQHGGSQVGNVTRHSEDELIAMARQAVGLDPHFEKRKAKSRTTSKADAKRYGMELYHQTDEATAEIILKTQVMKPGSKGLAGGGIYFATTPELTGHKAQSKGVILKAYVHIGKIKTLEANGDTSMTSDKLKKEGYDAVCIARKVSSGQEYVVYDPAQVLFIERA
jgi:hypothetical protein